MNTILYNYFLNREYDKSIEYIKKCLKLNLRIDYYVLIIKVYLSLGNFKEAQNCLVKLKSVKIAEKPYKLMASYYAFKTY